MDMTYDPAYGPYDDSAKWIMNLPLPSADPSYYHTAESICPWYPAQDYPSCVENQNITPQTSCCSACATGVVGKCASKTASKACGPCANARSHDPTRVGNTAINYLRDHSSTAAMANGRSRMSKKRSSRMAANGRAGSDFSGIATFVLLAGVGLAGLWIYESAQTTRSLVSEAGTTIRSPEGSALAAGLLL